MNQILILLTALCISISNCFGQSYADLTPMKDIAGFKKSLTETTKNTKTIKSDFVQKKKLKVMKAPITSSGYILFQQPQNLKWAYSEPYVYAIILNSLEMIVDDAGKINRIPLNENPLFSDLSQMIISSVEGTILEDNRFTKDYFKSEEYNVVMLEPNEADMKKYLNKMTLYFDKTDFSVRKIIMEESKENYTEIIFSNLQPNIAIAPNAFKAN
jgi:outer membrane lipoprotein carrier protein